MRYENPNSKRTNPFRDVYDNVEFNTVLQHKDRLPTFPYLVDIELTNYCNLQCIFCGQQAMTREKGFISEEIFKKVVDECSQYNTPIRLIRFGEPFLHKKIVEFCKYVKSKRLPLHITTNGLFYNNNDMKALIDTGVDSIIFSFQGATREQYEIMRQNNQYDKLKSNIMEMVRLRGDKPKPFIHVSSTMTDESQKDIDNFVDYWVHIVDSVGIGKTNLSQLSANQIKSFEAIGKLEVLKKQEVIKKNYRPCSEIYQKLSVDWDGKVTGCCGDFDNLLTVGNVNVSTLAEIWKNSKELKIFRELLNKCQHRCLTLCSTCYPVYEEFQ